MNKTEREELRALAEEASRNPEMDSYFREKANLTSVIALLDYIEELEKVAGSLIELVPQVKGMARAIELTNEYLASMVEEARANPEINGVLWMMEMIADSINQIQTAALLGATK